MYRDAADFVDDSISTSYADANLDLSRKMTVLSCIQAVVAVIPFVMAEFEFYEMFVR